jgi:NADPH-dependent ferric siderophore reductase
MASAKGVLLDVFSRFITRTARVSAVRDIGPGLRVVGLVGPDLRDASWVAGDKIQILLPTRDVRTYTPSRWTGDELELVAFDHGDAPGSTWSRRAKVGDELRFVGPQRSLRRTVRPTVLFGDETSFGLAVAFGAAGGGALTSVLEVGLAAHSAIVADLGVAATCVVREPADRHLDEVAAALAAALRADARSELVMSGRAQSIQLVRQRLRGLGVTSAPANKAYWSVGKTGLD